MRAGPVRRVVLTVLMLLAAIVCGTITPPESSIAVMSHSVGTDAVLQRASLFP
jgi:hypothetical protein